MSRRDTIDRFDPELGLRSKLLDVFFLSTIFVNKSQQTMYPGDRLGGFCRAGNPLGCRM